MPEREKLFSPCPRFDHCTSINQRHKKQGKSEIRTKKKKKKKKKKREQQDGARTISFEG